MTEVELKLQVPPSALKAIERLLSTAPSVRTRLQALYFDTPDRRLARAGIAVRLRKEGRRWVQTLKSGPAHGMERGEHNVVVPAPVTSPPALDLARHAGTPPGDALAAALTVTEGEAPPVLAAVYTTDISRRHRQQRTRHGVVELALDRGEIVAAGPDGQERRWPVCELEIELISGSPRAVTDRARLLAARHGLWLDVRTKAERGDRLARGVVMAPAVKAEPLALHKTMSAHAAWAAVVRNVLAQGLPNWSELAGGEALPEHVHQLRVALRRLRSAQRLFEGWPGVPEPGWGEGVAALFQLLGAVRDRDVLAGGLRRDIDTALDAIGEPALVWPAAETAADAGLAALHGAGLALIETLDYAVTALAAEPPAVSSPPLATLAAERLADWHAQVVRDAKRFDVLTDEARHRLRKRLKRLRYGVEFTAALFPKRAVERYLKPLREAQEHLGEFNDVCVAQAAYRQLAQTEPRAWFGLGWLAQQRERVLADCRVGLKHLRRAEPFWDR